MKKNIFVFTAILISVTLFSACSLTNKNFSLTEKPQVKYGEEVNRKIAENEYQYRDENQAAEEMELVMPVNESTEISDIEKDLKSLEILEEDFSDL